MDRYSERYFFLSGFISFSLFALLLLLIGYSILPSSKIEQFAMTQSDIISVSIALSEPTPEPDLPSVPDQSIAEPAEAKPVATEEKPAEKVPEIADLFSQVKPDRQPKKTVRSEALSELEKELTTPSEKQRFTDKVKNVELVKPGMKMVVQGGSTGPIVNEYHAKIQGLIYKHFHPPTGSEGQAARVRIKISPSGKLLSYKVMAYSGSTPLNNEVDWLKERLGSISFPSHPENREAVLECILTAKE